MVLVKINREAPYPEQLEAGYMEQQTETWQSNCSPYMTVVQCFQDTPAALQERMLQSRCDFRGADNPMVLHMHSMTPQIIP